MNQTIKDMALGIRSIILKPEPIYVQLEDIFAIGTNTEVEATLKKMEVWPEINQEVILSNRHHFRGCLLRQFLYESFYPNKHPMIE